MAQPTDDSSKKHAINFINEKFGDDAKSLVNVTELYEQEKRKTKKLESQLTLANDEIPNEVDMALQNAETTQRTLHKLHNRSETLRHDILDHVRTVKPLVEDAKILTNQIQDLQKYTQYLTCVSKLEDLSSQIQTSLLTEDMESAVQTFCSMTSLYSHLCGSQCANLLRFAKETVLFWYKILKEKIASEFENILKSVGWPFISTSVKAPPVQGPEIHSTMDALFTQLLQLQLPDSLSLSVQTTEITLLSQKVAIKPLLLPLQLMVIPLKKRFRYHFYGNKQTNKVGKPEWYLGQILSWIRDHSTFLSERVQPLLQSSGLGSVDAKVEFMRGLVVLVMEKMAADLPSMMDDEHLFSHLVDEAIFFDKELHNTYYFPPGLPSSMDVLTLSEAFQHWTEIENKFAHEKMDLMLSSSTAWQSQYKDIVDIDDLKVPECSESFITLMSTITDRYKHLPSHEHQLKFLQLQLELLEDFRIRLVQVMKEVTHNPLSETFCAILNAVYFVTEVLREWSNIGFFVELQYYSAKYRENDYLNQTTDLSGVNTTTSSMSQLNEPSMASMGIDSSVFDEVVDLFDNLQGEMLKNIIHHVFTDVQARSHSYKKERWISLPFNKDIIGQGLSNSACEMLLILKNHLSNMQNLLSKPLFTLMWQKLAERLSKFMLEEVILQNRFNEGGAVQLQFDMTRNLFPLFGEYTHKPESYFREVKEACVLLTMKVGSALLLKDVITGDGSHKKQTKTDVDSALHEIGVYKLKSQTALNILNSRTNLSV